MERGLLLFGLILLVLSGGLGYASMSLVETNEHEYQYTVKAEQVNEHEVVDESIDYDNVSDAEQKVLFDAFKESDHFLGGAEAYIETDEPIENVSNEWRVIEIKGVPMLVAIQGPETVPGDAGVHNLFAGIGMFVALLLGLLGLAATKDGLPGVEY